MSNRVLLPDGYYHVYNRGTDRRLIFQDNADYERFLETITKIKMFGSATNRKAKPINTPLIAYALNPNHFHLVLKQTRDSDISSLMQRLGTSYTLAFNKKYKRNGVLFQGVFKSTFVTSDAHLLWLTSYVNTNPQLHGIIADARRYQWCSYPEYLGIASNYFCDDLIVRNQFENPDSYDASLQLQLPTLLENQTLKEHWHDEAKP